jgi:putative membrane protein
MWHFMDHGWWGGGMVLWGVFWIAVTVALVWIAKAALDRSRVREGPEPRPESPLEILQRRYARGEIDRAEFEEKRRDLS